MNKIVAEILEHESKAITSIPPENPYDACIETIYHAVHERNGKVVASGVGKAGQIAHNIATTFSSTGTPAVFLHPTEAQHGDIGLIQKNDVLLLISNSGKTLEVLDLINLSKALYKDIPVIAISGHPEAPIAEHVDHILYTGNPSEVCPLGLSPTTSTTVMTVIGDILISLMMRRINFTAEAYAKRHHGGYLGEKALQEQNT